MNNFVFKIFGAPHTFDLYQGNGSEIGYFQNFDNGSKENTKLTIHRMASGRVSYTYLRYNFISGTGRPNSFFGMSVLFDNEYCKDIEKIFDLFDVIYNNIILENGILLTELKGNMSAQAKYLVRTFAEAEGEVRNVENNILNNLKTHFKGDVLPLDNSFLESNSMIKLNDKMGNAAFVSALKKCSWVNISSAYSTNEEPIPNPEFLADLDSVIEDVPKQMSSISVRVAKKENIQNDIYILINRIQNALIKIDVWLEKEYSLPKTANIYSYLQKQPELKKRREKLLEIQTPLNELLNVVDVQGSENSGGGGTVTENGDTNSGGNNDGSLSPVTFPFWKKPPLIAGAVVAVLMLVCVLFFIPKGKEPKDATTESSAKKDSTELLIAEGNSFLEKNIFDKAISKFEQVGKSDLVEAAKSKAVEYWYAQAVEANENLQKRLTCFENAKKYGGYPSTNNDIADVQKKIDEANVVAEKEKKTKEEADKKVKESENNAQKKEESNNDECKTINKKIDSQNSKEVWTISELLKEAKLKLKAQSYTIVIDIYNAIIEKQKNCPGFATIEQLNEAEKLNKNAELLKRKKESQ